MLHEGHGLLHMAEKLNYDLGLTWIVNSFPIRMRFHFFSCSMSHSTSHSNMAAIIRFSFQLHIGTYISTLNVTQYIVCKCVFGCKLVFL